MRKGDHPNYALICGLLRDELELRITLAQVVEARTDGLLDGIVLSTWVGEIEAIPGLREDLVNLNISLVETHPPKFNLTGNAWAQHKAILQGLRLIPDGSAVWKLRTDRTSHLLKMFRPFLEMGPSQVRQIGNIPPVFGHRVAAMAVVATAPFYAADFAFYGMKQDILRMIHFEGVYDSLFRGFGAENRLWTHPFLGRFPRLAELYEHVNVLGLSTHVVRAASEAHAIPDYVLYFLAFYWVQLFANIQVMDNRAGNPMNLTVRGALGGERCGAMRTGAVASSFTVKIAVFNSQEVLDRLVEGRFDDDSELGARYRGILEAVKANGMDALPDWSDAVAGQLQEWQDVAEDAELLIAPSRVSMATDAPPQATPTAILSGDHFKQMLARASLAGDVDDETLALVREKLELAHTGVDTGRLYHMIATEIFRTACDDRSRKLLGGFFLLRAAERGNVDAAGRYGWLVYSGRLEQDTREHATRWARNAAVKENPLAQYTCSLMCKNGWFGDEHRREAEAWHQKALKNGFTTAMLNAE